MDTTYISNMIWGVLQAYQSFWVDDRHFDIYV